MLRITCTFAFGPPEIIKLPLARITCEPVDNEYDRFTRIIMQHPEFPDYPTWLYPSTGGKIEIEAL